MCTWIIALPVLYFIFKQVREKQKQAKREAYIRRFTFPRGLLRRVHQKNPHLSQSQLDQDDLTLPHLFLASLKSSDQPIATSSLLAHTVVRGDWQSEIQCSNV
jgi:hypothetical protein